MKKPTILTIFFLSLIINLLVGCSSANEIKNNPTEEYTQQEQQSPHIRGMITSLSSRDDNSISLFVEGVIENDTRYDKAYIEVDEDTEIFLVKNNNVSKMKFSDLKIGQTIEVFFIGAIATSDPVQATAGKINIIEGSTK